MKSLDAVIHRIYEAALRPDLWPQALDGIASLSHSAGAIIYAKTSDGWKIISASESLVKVAAAYVEEAWHKQNPWLQGRVEFGFHAGDVYTDRDVVSPEEMNQLPFYVDFLARFQLHWQMAAIIHSELGQPTSVVVQRGRAGGAFTEAEVEGLLMVSRHLEQSLRISASYLQEHKARRTAALAFHEMSLPAFILDERQKLLQVNKAAEPLFGRYFVRVNDEARPAVHQDEKAFSSVVGQALLAPAEDGALPEPVTVSGPQDEDRLVVWAVPLVEELAGQLGLQQGLRNVLVLAKPLHHNHAVDPTIIRSIYGLTTSEARLASVLVAGKTVKEAAGELGITEGTARVVLKRIFPKIGVNRQSELVAKIGVLSR